MQMGPLAAAVQQALINCFEAAVHDVLTALPTPNEAGALLTAAQVLWLQSLRHMPVVPKQQLCELQRAVLVAATLHDAAAVYIS